MGPHVVILGGGFGGLYAARALARAPCRVTVVDKTNHHVFQPLLYQVASCALNPSDIAQPIRRILRTQKNVDVLLAEAKAIDTAGKTVRFADGPSIAYDYLIVATGATHSYFGHEAWEASAPALKTIDDALAIRQRVLLAYESAEKEDPRDVALRKAWLTFVVVGGGPTGVELAGALAEISRNMLRKDFRHIDPTTAKVMLVEAGPRLLSTFAPDFSADAQKKLAQKGVDVRTGTAVSAIDAEGVALGGERILARTVVWAAGVAASPLGRLLGAELDRAGRVRVQPDLSVAGAPDVFVIGDLAALEQDGKPVGGVAPVAIQGGRHTAKNIVRKMRGEPTVPFRYVDKGLLATIGRAAAVAQFGRVRLRGFIAWLAWLFIHVVLLIGFRNRLLVLLAWAWEYWTYDRGPRLITGNGAARAAAARPAGPA